jgi:hypothetical protein
MKVQNCQYRRHLAKKVPIIRPADEGIKVSTSKMRKSAYSLGLRRAVKDVKVSISKVLRQTSANTFGLQMKA